MRFIAATGAGFVFVGALVLSLLGMPDSAASTAPVITSASTSTPALDVCLDTATILIDVTGVDADLNMSHVIATVTGADGSLNPARVDFVGGLEQESLVLEVVVPRYAQAGTWSVTGLVISDGTTLRIYTDPVRQFAEAFPSGSIDVAVTSCPHPDNPDITSVAIAPTAVDVCTGDGVATVTIAATDPNADLVSGEAFFIQDSGGIAHPANVVFDGGSDAEVATAQVVLPQGSNLGTWYLSYVAVVDGEGNIDNRGPYSYMGNQGGTTIPGDASLEAECVELVDDEVSIVAPQAVRVAALANDPSATDIVSVTAADGAQGTTSVDTATNEIVYTPGVSSSVVDEFAYTACTATACAQATVTISITPPRCIGVVATIWGTEGADVIHGPDGIGVHVYVSFGGDDDITTGDNHPSFYNLVCSGSGNDTITFGTGAARLKAGPGDDVAYGAAGRDVLLGEEGNDTLYGYGGRDTLAGGDGQDLIYGGADTDLLRGGDDDDQLFSGPSGNDRMAGGAGDDIIDARGTTGSTRLLGDDGDDTIYGSNQLDRIWGFGGNDVIYGGPYHDLLRGGDGDDEIYGEVGRDTLDGGAGDDLLYGGETGLDKLVGLTGVDLCDGGPGLGDYAHSSCETITGVP